MINEKFYLPTDLTAEDAVISASMINADAIAETEFLTVEDFTSIENKIIYGAIRNLYERGERIDMITLINELREHNNLDAAGGISKITLVANAVPTAAGILHHAKILRQLTQYRALIDVGNKIQQLGYEANEPQAFEIAMQALSKASLLGDNETASEASNDIDDAIDALRKEQEGGLLGLSTGLKSLDDLMRGFRKGDYILLGARPSMGKTSLAAHFALEVAKGGATVAMFTLEMTKRQIQQRLLTNLANFSAKDTMLIKDTKIEKAKETLKSYHILIDEKSNTLSAIRSCCRRIQSRQFLDFIIIDYVNLLQASQKGFANRTEAMSEISRELKRFAKEIDIPVLVLCQLNREAERRGNNRPSMGDIRETGSFEQDADLIMLLYRDDYYKEKDEKKDYTAEVIVAKNRNGKTGTATVFFDGDRQMWRSIDYNPAYNNKYVKQLDDAIKDGDKDEAE